MAKKRPQPAGGMKRGMKFTTERPKRLASTAIYIYPYSFFEKNYRVRSLVSRFAKRLQVEVSGTEHTVTAASGKLLNGN